MPGAQRGSASDLEALFRLHWPRAHRAAYLVTHDAQASEDIAQESFLAAIRALDRFDRGDHSAPGSIGSWSTARSTGLGTPSAAEVELTESASPPSLDPEPPDDVVAALERSHRNIER